jgi:hypothetical protein
LAPDLSVGANFGDGLHDQPLLLERRGGRLQNVEADFFEEDLHLKFGVNE